MAAFRLLYKDDDKTKWQAKPFSTITGMADFIADNPRIEVFGAFRVDQPFTDSIIALSKKRATIKEFNDLQFKARLKGYKLVPKDAEVKVSPTAYQHIITNEIIELVSHEVGDY